MGIYCLRALRDALVSTFPGARAAGCWFHHNQAVWRKMSKLGYLNYANHNENALKTVKLLLCLPLLPARNIERGFTLIKAFVHHRGVHLERLLLYYQRYLIRSVGPEVVSVNGLPRKTNNSCESFHAKLNALFHSGHPNIFIHVVTLLGIQCDTYIKLPSNATTKTSTI
ncbi:uncharacterized protein LOC126839478 [Adelges cooleyi]|uniref:uncharacterized protein LOC126839478 n=1 Tax=Adelges cooleyi TaxID=133065 RepID=UPI00217FD4CF|nr:uncharacterized protein LOC126839478 [Adelges cooleyi]